MFPSRERDNIKLLEKARRSFSVILYYYYRGCPIECAVIGSSVIFLLLSLKENYMFAINN